MTFSAIYVALMLALFPAPAKAVPHIAAASAGWTYHTQKSSWSHGELRTACTTSQDGSAQLCIRAEGGTTQVAIKAGEGVACAQNSWCLAMFELDGAARAFPAQRDGDSLVFSDAGLMPERVAASRSAVVSLKTEAGEKQLRFVTANFRPQGFALRQQVALN